MPAILAHWLVIQEVALEYIKKEMKGNEYFKFSIGNDDDKFKVIDTSKQYEKEINRIKEKMEDTFFCKMLIEKKQDVEISRYLYFGANGPDLPYFYDVDLTGKLFGTPGESKWSDYFHYNNQSEFLLNLVCATKNISDEKKKHKYRVLGYALGHATHIAVDTIMHPYVNLLAGVYHTQVYEDIHRISECHQDSWLAQKYFGLEFLDTPASFWDSWTDYIPPWNETDNVLPPETEDVLSVINSAFQVTYQISPGKKYFITSYGNYFNNVLDVAYDTATKVPKNPIEKLVQHAGLKGESDYINYTKLIIKKAVPEAFNACKNVINLFESICKANNNKEEEKVKNTFRSVVRNWNMDTGYRIEVDMNEAGQPRITWRHRWCQK